MNEKEIEDVYTEFLKNRIKALEKENKELRNHVDALILDVAFYEKTKNGG